MKIGILTLPLHTNYGGILQAYALQTVLERMGHEVKVIDKEYIKEEPSFLVYMYRTIMKIFGHKDIHVFSERYNNSYEEYTRKKTSVFISKHIHRRLVNCLNELKPDEFDAIVVGSDQVWRPYYFKGIYKVEMENAFLSFAEDWNIKRVAYAASLGVDEWEYTEEETGNIKTFIQLFDAISVREMSGVDLCRSHFNVETKHVLDPTMLLNSDDYLTLFVGRSNPPVGDLLCYVLDPDEHKQGIIDEVANSLHLTPFSTKADKCYEIQPPVEDWVRAFHEAEFVVTDSFHACVFSILNHKPFIAIANESRGKGRFLSLLSTFGLEDRLVDSATTDINTLINLPIDYAQVDRILAEKREKSMNFLKQYLS